MAPVHTLPAPRPARLLVLDRSELYSKEKRMNNEEGETLESALSHPASPSRRSQATSSPIQIPRFGGLPVA